MRYWLVRAAGPRKPIYSIFSEERAARKAAYEITEELGWEAEYLEVSAERLLIKGEVIQTNPF